MIILIRKFFASARRSRDTRKISGSRLARGKAASSAIFATRTAPVIGLLGLLWLIPAHAADSLDLEGATITGSQELPKALHIVPWKSAVAGDLAGRPLNSLVDEILAPVDRDVFLRELEYYEAVHSSE